MSVAGFDFGNTNLVVALARRGGIDVVMNEVSSRLTPALVSFDHQQRHIGNSGANQIVSNAKNTITDLKRFLGRRFYEKDLQKELEYVQYKVVDTGEGHLGMQVNYQGELKTFTPEMVAAMLLVSMKGIADMNNNGQKVTDCVISAPIYWTDAQRRAMLDACDIAGLKCLRLMNETTATALGYGIVKTDLPEKDPIKLMFVDMGHSSLQVAVASFIKGEVTILATGYDRDLGGRDFDELLVNHFAEQWKAKHKFDIRTNPKALLRTRIMAEKMKKTLSANSEASISVECVMNEVDVGGHLKRAEFEAMCAPLFERIRGVLLRTLEASGVKKEEVYGVELVGGATRMPSVMRLATELFGKEPFRTTNSEEAVARGCALQGAMLSPAFKVREFKVHDVSPFPIGVSWRQTSADAMAVDAGSNVATTGVFPRHSALPSTKLLTFKKSEPFSLDVLYMSPADDLPDGMKPDIGRAEVAGIPAIKDPAAAKIKVKVKLNLHGVCYVDSANLHQEEDEPAAEPAAAPAEGAAPAAAAPEAGPADGAAAQEAAADQESTMQDEKSETADAAKRKKKIRKVDLQVTFRPFGGMAKHQIDAAAEAEFKMQLDDRVVLETAERKNALESYVYDMRTKLNEHLAEYSAAKEREALLARLSEMEEWLYGEGDEATKGVYVAKLDELKKSGDPIETRAREAGTRPKEIAALQAAIEAFVCFATSTEEKYEHIEQAEKEKVMSESNAANSWLNEMIEKQSKLAKTDNPVLLTADIAKKREALEKACQPIVSKPKPKPKPATPAPPPAPEAAPASPADGPASEPTSPEAAPAPAEGMDVDEKPAQ